MKDTCAVEDWDRTVNSTFWDIEDKRRLGLAESVEKFQSKCFTDILREKNTVESKVPFLLDTSGLNQTLVREKSTKQRGTIRSSLSKNKSALSGLKRTRHVRIDDVVPSSPICSLDGDQKENEENDVDEDIEEVDLDEDDTAVDIEEDEQEQEQEIDENENENEFSEGEPDDDLDDSLVSPTKRTFDGMESDTRKRMK